MTHRIKIAYNSAVKPMTLYITEKQFNSYGIKPDLKYLFMLVGSRCFKLSIEVIDEYSVDDSRLYLSQDLEYYTGLPEGMNLLIRKVEDDKFELGPYLGIFINHDRFKDLLRGKRFSEFTEYATTCRKLGGLCCFFSLDCINWSSHSVRCLIKNGSSWIESELPLSRIIYNRNVENDCLAESLALIKRLGENYQVLNATPKLSKWETAVVFQKHSSLRNVIPETISYSSPEEIEKLLLKYPCLYLKPNKLSKGRGIFRVSKSGDGHFRVEYRTSEFNHIVNLENLHEIDTLLLSYSEVGGGYVVQQEIHKACFKGNPFDLRVLFQKDFQGNWQLSGIAGRIAAPGSVITSPRSGGDVESLPAILKEIPGVSPAVSDKLQDDILKLGREICLAIEEEFGNCIELGLDLAIDVELNLWIIEVNGKPLRVSLKRLGNPEINSLCNRRPIEYLAYLSGFESWDTGVSQ